MANASIAAFNELQTPQGAAAIHWFGQSSFAIKDSHGTVTLVDPYFPRERSPERFIHLEPPVDEADVRTDWVLLTHNHRDHTCGETVARIAKAWPNARFVGPRESVERVLQEGIDASKTRVVGAGDAFALGTMTVHAVYAKPPSGDPQRGIAPPDVTHLGYVVDVGGTRVYITGDPINTFADRADLVEPVARLRPHIGLLTTHPTEGEFPFFEGSVRMAELIGLETAVPAHYACFVKRTYDPAEWAQGFAKSDVETLIPPYNTWFVHASKARQS